MCYAHTMSCFEVGVVDDTANLSLTYNKNAIKIVIQNEGITVSAATCDRNDFPTHIQEYMITRKCYEYFVCYQ